jgi:hypothetical protein
VQVGGWEIQVYGALLMRRRTECSAFLRSRIFLCLRRQVRSHKGVGGKNHSECLVLLLVARHSLAWKYIWGTSARP